MAGDSKGKQSRFDLIIGATDKFSNVFKGFNERLDSATANMKRMQGAMRNLSRATGISRLTGAAKDVAGGMKNVVSEGKSLVSTVTRLAGKLSLVFGAAGGGVFALAKSTANAGRAATDAAARAGVGVRTWQEYAHAANLSGVGTEQLEKSMVKLQDVAIKAFQGDVTQMSLLRMAGINPKTAKGEVKNADSLFLELADKVKKLRDAGQEAKAGNLLKNVFGDTSLMPLLSAGSAGLKDMRLEAHKLGLALSEDNAKASADFTTGLARMTGSLRGIGLSIGTTMMPPLTKLMGKFTEWSASQREIIGTRFAEWVENLDIDKIWQSVESGLGTLADLGKAVNSLAQAFGGWENVALALAGVISGKFILSLGNLALAFGRLGLAILTTPVGWFLAACAGIGAAVYAIYKNWDDIVAYFQGLWQGVKEAFSRNWLEGVVKLLWDFNPLRLVLKGINELIAYFTGINLMEHGAKIIDSLGEGISAAWKSLTDWFMGKLKWFSDKWNKVKSLFGFGKGEPLGVSLDDDSGGYKGSGRAEPLNLTKDARAIAETRSEHVERQENTVTLVPPDGWGMQVSGSSSGVRQSGTSMQIGYEAYGY